MAKDESNAEGRNPDIDRRHEGAFAERVGRGLRSPADLLARTGRASSNVRSPSPLARLKGDASEVETLASLIATSAAKIMGREAVDPEIDFFTLGGSSVDAVQLAALLSREHGIKLSLDDLFADARPRRLAERWVARAAATALPMSTSDTPVGQVKLTLPDNTEEELRAIQKDLERADALPWVAAPSLEPPRRILLTGASGFLGSHVLFDLLRRSDAHVVCLVRAKDDKKASERLAKELQARDLPWSTELERRITVLAGDIQQPRLGWEQGEWEALANEVDSVVNVAATVDFLRGYQSLRQSNVHGPLTLAEFATTGRVKPLHHVSTIAVFDELGIQSITEDAPPAHIGRLFAGYEKSKWAAEAALRRARDRGLVVTLLRPGGIGGHTVTGAYNPRDVASGLLAAYPLLGVMPEFRYMNVAPVDWVSRTLAEIVLDPNAWGHNYHLTGKPLSMEDATRGLAQGGMRIGVVSLEEWRRRFLARMAADPLPHLEYVARVLESPTAFKLVEATFSAPAASSERTDTFVHRKRLPRAAAFDAKATVATSERLARDGIAKLPGRDDPPYLQFDETMEGELGPVGSPPDSPCTFKLKLSIASFYQILRGRRLDIHGSVHCERIHEAPLRIESGSCWIRPDDGVPERHGLVHPLLRYSLVLRTADGDSLWLEGTKITYPGIDLWRQGRTLPIEVGRKGEPASFAGEVVVPSSSYFPDQVAGLEINPGAPASERRTAKLRWFAWLGAQFGLGFSDPILRSVAELLDARKSSRQNEIQG